MSACLHISVHPSSEVHVLERLEHLLHAGCHYLPTLETLSCEKAT